MHRTCLARKREGERRGTYLSRGIGPLFFFFLHREIDFPCLPLCRAKESRVKSRPCENHRVVRRAPMRYGSKFIASHKFRSTRTLVSGIERSPSFAINRRNVFARCAPPSSRIERSAKMHRPTGGLLVNLQEHSSIRFHSTIRSKLRE